ncbi:unnamed protein product [Withania somnifera]
MSGFDDRVPVFGDWIPRSPSPTVFVSSLLIDDVGGWLPHTEQTNESKCRNFVSEPQHVTWCSSEEKDGARAGAATVQTVKLSAPSELNTDGLIPPVLTQNQQVRSPYLNIPAGLSPSVLLYSPVLMYNSLESKNVMSTTAAEDKRTETSSGSNPIMETGRFIQITLNLIQWTSQNEQIRHETSDFPMFSTEEDGRDSDIKPETRTFNVAGGSMEHSPSLHEQQVRDAEPRGGEDSNCVDASTGDGFNWRKYGQNQVKGSEYPRSYYKCTRPSCPVKKKIGRYQGHVTEVIIQGAHNHPKPLPNKRLALGSSNSFGDMQLNNMDPSGTGVNSELVLATIQQGPTAGGLEWRNNNLEVASLAAWPSEYCSGTATLHSNGSQLGSADAVAVSSTFPKNEDEYGHGTYSVSAGYDAGGDQSENNKPNAMAMSGTSKAIREPKIVVQTTSEVDILDDGYLWRMSYYKCTSPGCNVRKHIERAPHGPKTIITTYEGNSSQVSSGVPISLSNRITADAQSHVGRPEPTQLQNTSEHYGRAPSLGSTSGSNNFGTNQQQGLPDISVAEFNSDQLLFSVPTHPYIGYPQPANDTSFELSQGEPMPDPSLNYPNGSSTYQQIMNGLPPGPHM